MDGVDITIEICGMSGDGTIAAGGLLNAAMSHAGFSVLAFDSYPAEIRGFGRCVTTSRIGDEDMLALSDKTNVLISLDDEQSQSRVPFLVPGAVVLFDNRPPSYVEEEGAIPAHVEPDVQLYGIPFSDLAAKASDSKRGRNLVALGAFTSIFKMLPDDFQKVIEKKFFPQGGQGFRGKLAVFPGRLRVWERDF